MENATEKEKHSLHLEARRTVTLSGVTDVKSFDEEQIELITACGALTVEGEGLHVGTLDMTKGAVEVTGRIDGLHYSDTAPTGRTRRR